MMPAEKIAEERTRPNAAEPNARRWPSLSERARRVGTNEPRIRTGFATLDAACRGGLLRGRQVVIQGPPGARKTAVAAQMAHGFARAGLEVTFVAFDEEAEAVHIRWGQAAGLDRDRLEAGDPDERALLEERLAELPIELVDADEDGITIEDAIEDLVRRAGDKPAALFADSIQTARTRTSSDADGPRARVDDLMQVLKSYRKKHRLIVVMTSEVGRGGYRSKMQNERVDELAASKESSSIEYHAHVLLDLRGVEDSDDLVDVKVPKNRLGKKTPFRLKMDPQRATLAEVDRPADVDATRKRDTFEQIKKRVVETLRKHHDLRSKNGICRETRGTKVDIIDAIDVLTDDGVIALVGGVYRNAPPPVAQEAAE